MISNRPHLFTSESVTEGHPDKLADLISDSILDGILAVDPEARVAIECLLKTGVCMIAGEVTSKHQVEYAKIARECIKSVGYTEHNLGFHHEDCSVFLAIDGQSPDIAKGVDLAKDKEQGAGDQGLMFGYACEETKELMPLPITYAHALARRLAYVRKEKIVPFLGPDGKTQVTVRYVAQKPVAVSKIVISSQHAAGTSQTVIKEALIEEVIKKVIPAEHLDRDIKYFINPTGSFVIGGPKGDTGLTGRKIIVDTYGGMARHGGGAFSGKDPSKTDRSAAYLARYLAKNVVASGLASRCEVQIAFAIGVSEPVNLTLNTFQTATIEEEKIEKTLKEIACLKPADFIRHLNLKQPIYAKTASYGHFGCEGFSWERTDLAPLIKSRIV